MEHVKCLIIGSGPAGYTAAIYAGRANLQPVEYCGMQTGGQLTQTTIVENFPGYPEGVDANQMMMEIREQAERFGCDISYVEVIDVDFSKKPYIVTIDGDKQLEADTVIIATGAKAKYLGLPDEEKYNGQGVSACATCDGFFYRKKVYLVVRKNYLRASEIMQQRVKDAENIEILFEHNATGLYGENGVEGMHLVYRKGEADEKKYDVAIDGFFLAIGHKPNTDIFKGQIDLDEMGYIKNIAGTPRTNVEGVFAAGDVCDPTYRQAIVAAGSGCMAALEAQHYLQNNA